MYIGILDRFAGHLLAQLADASVRATILALLIAAVTQLLRRRPAAQHALWTLVVAGMLMLPVLRSFIPPTHLPMAEPAALDALGFNPAQFGPAPPVPLVSFQPRPSSVHLGWRSYLAFLYLAGLVIFAWRLAMGALLNQRALRTGKSITQELGRFLPNALIGDLEIQESDRVQVPVVAGLTRMRIVLPAEWRNWPPSRLRAAIVHESAHLRRRDPAVALLAALNETVFWFHPLAWWLERRLAVLAEHVADDQALAALPDARAYARAILDVATQLRNCGGRVLWNSSSMSGPLVARRIRRILTVGGPPLVQPLGKASFSLLGLASVLFIWVVTAGDFQTLARAQRHSSSEEDGIQLGYSLAPINAVEPNPITVPQASMLELQLLKNPDDDQTRALLLLYYWRQGLEDQRIRSILWLIDHHPDSSLHQNGFACISPTGTLDHPGNTEAFADASRRWRTQVAEHPYDARVLGNAARALGQVDLAEEVDLLSRARNIDSRWTKPLALLDSYLLVWSAETGPTRTALKDARVAEQVREGLRVSDDARLVGSVAREVVEQAVRKSTGYEGGTWDIALLRSIARELVSHVESLDLQNEHFSEVMGGVGRWSDLMEGVNELANPKSTSAPRPTPRLLNVRQSEGRAPGNNAGKIELVELRIEGETAIPEADLTKIIADLKRREYSGSADVEEEILERLRAEWQNRGYFKAQITGESRLPASVGNSGRMAVTAHVIAGEKYFLEQISFTHNQVISDAKMLRAMFPIKDGDVFSRRKIAIGLENLRALYNEFGYINMTPVPDTRFDDAGHKAFLKIDLDEGRQFSISHISILGIDEGKLPIGLKLRAGDIYNQRLVDQFLTDNAGSLPPGSSGQSNVQLQRDEQHATVAITFDFRPKETQ